MSSSVLLALRKTLLDWFKENGRHWIPWKLKPDGAIPSSGESVSAYGIWIAEIMLQQTQLQVVLPYWERWMQTFPTLSDLAEADEQDVLILWQGLGYYARARRLHQSAKTLLDLIGKDRHVELTQWPHEIKTWIGLPGIGRSTAGSILSSAFDLPTPVLDGNVQRILARLIALPRPTQSAMKTLWRLSEALVDLSNPRHFNQALMDLGAKVCRPKNPNCDCCPWRDYCCAYSMGESQAFPVKRDTKSIPQQVIGVGIVLNRDGMVLIDQRLNEGLLGGMWEFPGGKQEDGETIEQTILRELREELAIEVEVGELLISLDHFYSHKKLRFIVHLCTLISGKPKALASQRVCWVEPKDLEKYPFPKANSKMIDALWNYL